MKAQPTVDKTIQAQDLWIGAMLYDDDLPRLVVDFYSIDDYPGPENLRIVVRLPDKALVLKPAELCRVQVPVYDDPFAGL